MSESSSGIILRTRPLTETSLIVNWLTPEIGRISTVAKGARRPKSSFSGKLDLFYELEFSFQRSKRSDLHVLREVSLKETNAGLRQELSHLQQACYCAALVEQATETETPMPVVFEMMMGLVRYLPLQPASARTVFSFELKLLGELGLGPEAESSSLKPGTRQMMAQLAGSEWEKLNRLRLSEAQELELSRFLHGFIIYHLERIPKGRQTALGIA